MIKKIVLIAILFLVIGCEQSEHEYFDIEIYDRTEIKWDCVTINGINYPYYNLITGIEFKCYKGMVVKASFLIENIEVYGEIKAEYPAKYVLIFNEEGFIFKEYPI